MADGKLIREKIHAAGLSVERAANMAEMTGATLTNKLQGRVKWFVEDVKTLQPLIHLTEEDIINIWFR